MSEAAAGELAGLLLRELDEAIGLAATHAPGIKIERLALRLGQGGDDHSLFLERYPDASGAWRMEIDATPQASSPKAAISSSAQLLDRFTQAPVAWLKGVDRTWSQRLQSIGIATLGKFVAASDDDLATLVEKHNSAQPLLLRARARLLRYPLPVWAASPLDQQAISDLVLQPLAVWQRQIAGTVVTAAELAALIEVAEVAVNCIDLVQLRRIKWAALRPPA
jgi:hypothetical protein